MIGAIGGLAMGAISSIAGGASSASAAKKQQALIAEQNAKNQAWYNKNYYSNYLDSSEARAAIKRVENTMSKRNQEAKASAVVTGATNEAVLAQQENDQQLMSDVVDNLASNATRRKEAIDTQKMNMDNNIASQQMAQLQANEAGGSQLLASGSGLIASALGMFPTKNKQ